MHILTKTGVFIGFFFLVSWLSNPLFGLTFDFKGHNLIWTNSYFHSIALLRHTKYIAWTRVIIVNITFCKMNYLCILFCLVLSLKCIFLWMCTSRWECSYKTQLPVQITKSQLKLWLCEMVTPLPFSLRELLFENCLYGGLKKTICKWGTLVLGNNSGFIPLQQTGRCNDVKSRKCNATFKKARKHCAHFPAIWLAEHL